MRWSNVRTGAPSWRLAAVVALITIFSPVSAAHATASSGIVYGTSSTMNNGNYDDQCVESIIADVADYKAFGYTYEAVGNLCSTPRSEPAGYIGAMFNAYMNGSYCGQSSTAYSPYATSSWGIGGAICGNPSGTQSFYTSGYAYFYEGPSYPYNNGYRIHGVTSPSQNY